MDLLHGFEVLSTTEETLFNSETYPVWCKIILVLYCLAYTADDDS